MGTKRTRSEIEGVHPTRQGQVPDASSQRPKKRRTVAGVIFRKPKSLTSINAIKKRIRDINRLLERSEKLPAGVRVENERALAAYQEEFAAAENEKQRQKMIKKYHMVRFFERQKATRQLGKLRKCLLEAQSPEEIESLKAQMHIAEVDLNYAKFYPLSQCYVSLYPRKTQQLDQNDVRHQDLDTATQKPPMWTEVEKSMINETLNQLRDGVKAKGIAPKEVQSAKLMSKSNSSQLIPEAKKSSRDKFTTAQAKISRQSNKIKKRNDPDDMRGHSQKGEGNNERDDESDGGFFEE